MNGLVTLRDVRESDLDAVMAIETAVFGHDAWPREAMHRDILHPATRYVVAEIPATGLVVGYAGLLCAPGSGDADIQTIAVAPEMRRRGIARSLMETLLAEAVDRKAHRVFLEVRADNPAAIDMYRDLGFVQTGVRKGYYQPDGVDALTMRLDLSPSARPGTRTAREEMEGAC